MGKLWALFSIVSIIRVLTLCWMQVILIPRSVSMRLPAPRLRMLRKFAVRALKVAAVSRNVSTQVRLSLSLSLWSETSCVTQRTAPPTSVSPRTRRWWWLGPGPRTRGAVPLWTPAITFFLHYTVLQSCHSAVLESFSFHKTGLIR